jgi:hypothetical protein
VLKIGFHSWPDGQRPAPETLDWFGLQFVGVEMAHQMAAVPFSSFASANVEHPADLHQAAFDTGVEALQPLGRRIHPQWILCQWVQLLDAANQPLELVDLHMQVQGQVCELLGAGSGHGELR